jgi:hypothetical protein
MIAKVLTVTGRLPDGTEVGLAAAAPTELYNELRTGSEDALSYWLRREHPEVGAITSVWMDYDVPEQGDEDDDH